jgi:hypothetical protein
MPLDRVGPRAFGVSCDRCKRTAPTVIVGMARDREVATHGVLDAIECAREKGFELAFCVEESGRVVVTRCVCPSCARLALN